MANLPVGLGPLGKVGMGLAMSEVNGTQNHAVGTQCVPSTHSLLLLVDPREPGLSSFAVSFAQVLPQQKRPVNQEHALDPCCYFVESTSVGEQ
jgi:hypothetical protein